MSAIRPTTLASKPGQVLLSPSNTFLVVTACSLFLGTIATTYTLCAFVEGKCPKFLPTISDTWVPPPGNYISRITVNLGCALLVAANFLIFFANEKRRVAMPVPHRAPRAWIPSNRLLLILSNFGIFCLSWVGAICDNHSNPTCRGLSTPHSILAVTFFVLYDFYMVALLNDRRLGSDADKNCNKVVRIFITFSLLTKSRYFVPLNETGLAVFEWTNVACITVFTVIYVLNNCTSVRAGLVKLISAEEQERLLTKGDIQVVGQVSLKSMMKALVHVGAFTTIIPFAFAYFFQPSDSIKDISASWVHIPGDLISRWGVMVSVQLLFWMQLGLFFSRQSWSTFRYTNLMLGLIALPGLAVAGVVDISEDDQIHTAGAVVFFAMSLLDMFSSAVDKFFSGAGNRCAVNAMLLISSVAVGATAYCFHDAVDFEHRSFHLQNVSSVTMVVYQWAMVVLMGLFYTLQVRSDNEAQAIGMGMYF